MVFGDFYVAHRVDDLEITLRSLLQLNFVAHRPDDLETKTMNVQKSLLVSSPR